MRLSACQLRTVQADLHADNDHAQFVPGSPVGQRIELSQASQKCL